MINASVDSAGLVSGISIVEAEIIEKGVPWDLKVLTSKEDREPFGLRCIHELGLTDALSVSCDIWLDKVVIKDTLLVFASSDGYERFPKDVKKPFTANKL